MSVSEPKPGPGLRERKRDRTKRLIGETARRLFLERGFDQVRVTEIAREAEVAEKTVFNYFPTKEDLVYWRLEDFEAELVGAIHERAPGQSALAAFSAFVHSQRGWLASDDPDVREQAEQTTRMITSSPALVAREGQVFADFTQTLAELLAKETGVAAGSAAPWVVANALIGVHRALVAVVRRAILDGTPHATIVRAYRREAKRALGALETGLADYAVKDDGRDRRRPSSPRRE